MARINPRPSASARLCRWIRSSTWAGVFTGRQDPVRRLIASHIMAALGAASSSVRGRSRRRGVRIISQKASRP